jgi:hypothetical protein
VLIHIGKTGGSTISEILKMYYPNCKEYHCHWDRDRKPNETYIIWIRNPISRFVSAFNYSHHLVTYNCSNKKPKDINMSNCLYPPAIKQRLVNNRSYTLGIEYDKLIKFFKSANDLAEGLTSNDIDIKQMAEKLMNSRIEHIYKGIGWYLNNGNFVRKRNKNILFVGKQETMKQDIESLGKILNKPFDKNLKVRTNIYSSNDSKYLSPLAIKNIIDFYKDTDYAALIALKDYGWITQETLDSYYFYSS